MALSSIRRVFVVTVTALCIGLAGPALAFEGQADPGAPSAAAMSLDVAVIRPISLVTTVVGTGVFLVSLPFAVFGMNTEEAIDQLVAKPALYTFRRPLGDFNDVPYQDR